MTAIQWTITDPARLAREVHERVDRRALADELQGVVEGEIRFDRGSRALYARDASNYRQIPLGVVVPRTVEDVVRTAEVARRHRAPLLVRGAGTGVAGQTTNTAVVVDTSKELRGLLELDPGRRLARVQPGIPLDDLRSAAEEHDLTFGPDPATHRWCTLGGMIGNDSCGVHSVMTGRTSENVEELEILTGDGVRMRVGATSEEALAAAIEEGGRRGEIHRGLRDLRDRYADRIRERFPRIPRLVSGYALQYLLPEHGFHLARALVGSEGTCVTVLEATVRLVHSPRARVLLVLGYPDVYAAGDDVPEILRFRPIGLEGLDDRLTEYMELKGLHARDLGLLPEGDGLLLAEFGGDDMNEARDRAREVMARLEQRPAPPTMRLLEGADAERVWEVRESGLGATAFVPGMDDTWPGWEDSAVAPERLGDYLRELRRLLDAHGYGCSLYGHFGQGCIHTRIDFGLEDPDGRARFRSFIEEAGDLVVRFGGSFSGEHGDGQARAELLPRMFGDDLVEAFREFKRIWDPEGALNPGKVVDPYPLDTNLALEADVPSPSEQTVFAYPDDQGSLTRATLRCVGVGKCRRADSGLMCPSYQATLQEKHSTRGRAHLLYEMLRGEVVTDGWRSDEVREALDLCLACKGCKGECPVNVDVGTYKAEFMAHYWAGRLRPRSAYAFGLIFHWARLASLAPGLVNAAGRMPVLSRLAKAVAGMAPERDVPEFAPGTFRAWFHRHPETDGEGPRVLLWVDTFTDHFQPDVAQSAVAVLEAAGFRVSIPDRWLCCGRPTYDFGFLDTARARLAESLEALAPAIDGDIPVVGLEPSCVSVFRDELRSLFPDDPRAQRLHDRVSTLEELLDRTGYEPPRLEARAIVQPHCHHRAILGLDADARVLAAAGLDAELLDAGCCGMAGPFGFEAGERYEVSMRVGERALLPAVRAAEPTTLIVADGFSCREQIAQTTGRRALHVAQVLHLALAGAGVDGRTAEEAYRELIAGDARYRLPRPRTLPVAAAAAAAALGSVVAWRRLRAAT